MILTKKDLREYIDSDRARYKLRKPRFLGRIFHDEEYYVTKFLSCLRHLEYYTNNKKWYMIPPYIYYFFRHRRLEFKIGIRIAPNIVEKGLYIPHIGSGVIVNALSVGENATINCGVVIGNKARPDFKPIIGNNVEITIGAKVIGRVVIGDDVIVAPNSVVVKDIPSKAVVSGVPAKIIKFND